MRGERLSKEILYRWRHHCGNQSRSDTTSSNKGEEGEVPEHWAAAGGEEEVEEVRGSVEEEKEEEDEKGKGVEEVGGEK